MRSSHMHRNLLAERLETISGSSALERHEHADLAEPRSDLVVDVGHDRALADFEHRGAAKRLVFADLGDVLRQRFGDCAAVRILSSAERLDVRAVLEDEL